MAIKQLYFQKQTLSCYLQNLSYTETDYNDYFLNQILWAPLKFCWVSEQNSAAAKPEYNWKYLWFQLRNVSKI